MAAPYVVSTYATNYATTGTSKTVTISCLANDTLFIFATAGKSTTFTTPTATGISFSSSWGSNGDATYPANKVYNAIRIASQTNKVITMGESSGTVPWGFTCVVTRNVSPGTSPTFSSNTSTSTLAQNAIAVTYPRPLILASYVDASANDGSARTWLTVDGKTPTAANGQELSYQYISTAFTSACAYYVPSGGGVKSIGVAFSGTMAYRSLFAAIPGDDAPIELSGTLSSYTTGTTKSASLTIATDTKYILAAVYVGVQPGNGTDSAITTTLSWGGIPCVSVQKIHANNGTQGYVEVFQLVSPSTGTKTLLATASASVDLTVLISPFANVDLANPINTIQTSTGSSSSASVSFSGLDVRNTVFSAIIAGNTISASTTLTGGGRSAAAAQTLYNTSSNGGAAAYSVIGVPGTSQTISHNVTSAPWAMISIALNPASGFPPQALYGFSA